MNQRAKELAAALIRNFNSAALETFSREPLYEGASARLALGTAARNLGATIDVLAPGKRGCPYHAHHAQEEMCVVLEGSGTLRVAGESLPVRAGDVVFIPPGPEYPHQFINTSSAPLKYLSISTKDSPEVVEYPDSGKFLAMASKQGAASPDFAVLHAKTENLDYWHGEP